MSENSLVLFTRAAEMLAEADTIQKAKELKDLALTAADWAARRNMGSEAIQYATSYARRAEIRMGEMLAVTERANAARDKKKAELREVIPPTLSELKITPRESSQAQQLARLPKEQQEAVIEGTKTVTQARRELQRAAVVREVQTMPTGKYRVILADPPWKYSDRCEAGSVQSGGAESHYPAMTISELCALPIADLAEDNSVLFIWVTAPILPEAFAIVKAWGFAYKTNFVWHKLAHNMGHYSSVRHEHLLLCTRGSCLPDIKELLPSVVEVKRKAHSEKPEEFRQMIDKLYPHGKRVELFARRKVSDQWDIWGNERPA